MIYLDTSALVKLVRAEAETDDLVAWLGERADLVTSSLARVELMRALREEGEAEKRQAATILVDIDQVPMTFDLLDAAGALPQPVRSLDAIHLASAIRLRDVLEAFVAYDKRLLAAADEVGLLTVAPGADG
ncbi:type II toxin-antitoxin system VapC family toxin [Lentzea sp. PSKA42]|uniref:Ribonuclease VapC n=1 Tax=Lentzea indica TaxID=2604800 RepID=A0ABX1FG77_9PSEU|nr:type II toxin-antitoxin system VapC family toxin [Lentzea indica]NKE57974.1 type II toxin-antitoxin system VapC family toxin [Lentzea indica]